MYSFVGKQAVVVGAGIAGLTAARSLADFFEHVIVLDNDYPKEPRPGQALRKAATFTSFCPADSRRFAVFSLVSKRVSLDPVPCGFAWATTTAWSAQDMTPSLDGISASRFTA